MQPHFVSDPLMAGRADFTKVSGLIRPLMLLVVFAACGPPLTQPSSQNISGHWTSTDHIGPVFNLEMVISQTADGTITGTWAGKVSPPHPVCPPDLEATSAGTITGTNTVIGVNLAILGTGDFQGQVIDGTTLRGSILSCASLYPVTWTLADPVPTG
jgi:hypothetical protein